MSISGTGSSNKGIDNVNLSGLVNDLSDLVNNAYQLGDDLDMGTASFRAPTIITNNLTSLGAPTTGITIFSEGNVNTIFGPSRTECFRPLISNDGLTIPTNLYSLFQTQNLGTWFDGVTQLCLYQPATTQINLPSSNAPTMSGSIFTIEEDGRYLINLQNVYGVSAASSLGNEYNIWLQVNASTDKLLWMRQTIQANTGSQFFIRQASGALVLNANDTIQIMRFQSSGGNGSWGFDNGSNEYGYISFLKLS